MANGIRIGYPRGFNRGRCSKVHVGSRLPQTPEEDRRIYLPKRCGNNDEEEVNNPNTLNDKNHQKFRQQFYGFKYSYVIHIICKELYAFNNLFLFNYDHLFAHSYVDIK